MWVIGIRNDEMFYFHSQTSNEKGQNFIEYHDNETNAYFRRYRDNYPVSLIRDLMYSMWDIAKKDMKHCALRTNSFMNPNSRFFQYAMIPVRSEGGLLRGYTADAEIGLAQHAMNPSPEASSGMSVASIIISILTLLVAGTLEMEKIDERKRERDHRKKEMEHERDQWEYEYWVEKERE